MTDILIGAMLIFALLLAILVGIWHWLKGLFHKQEEEKDVTGFHFSYRGNSLEEKLWLLTDHTLIFRHDSGHKKPGIQNALIRKALK